MEEKFYPHFKKEKRILLKSKKEGLNLFYRTIGNLFFWMSPKRKNINSMKLRSYYTRSSSKFRKSLDNVQNTPHKIDYESLLGLGLLKIKHYVYGSYLATFSTIPILNKISNDKDILESIFMKNSMAISTKVIDNLNDEWHDPKFAIECIDKLPDAFIQGEYGYSENSNSRIGKAENTALEIASWVGKCLQNIKEKAPASSILFARDVDRLVSGQKDSFYHKSYKKNKPILKMEDYLEKVTEKSIGSLWSDPDLCFLEKNSNGFSTKVRKKATSIRISSDLLIKSCLIYDDVVDFFYDLKTNSLNSMLVLAYDRGVTNPEEINKTSPETLLQTMYNKGIVSDMISIGDMIFLKAINSLNEIKSNDQIIDVKGLEFHHRLLRLFNLRKMIVRDRNIGGIRYALDSLGNLESLKENIPAHLKYLEKYIHGPKENYE
jgi:hypothetical protein